MSQACDGRGVAGLAVSEPVHNVIGSLHSSGVVALADAAALAAVLSTAPDEATARRLQPLGVQAEVVFHRPARGVAEAVCRLDSVAEQALADMYAGNRHQIRVNTRIEIGTSANAVAAEAVFTWAIRLAP